jgi:hypothetical protein
VSRRSGNGAWKISERSMVPAERPRRRPDETLRCPSGFPSRVPVSVPKVTVGDSEVVVRYQKRAHNPLLVAAGFDRLIRQSRGWVAGGCGSSSDSLFPRCRRSVV